MVGVTRFELVTSSVSGKRSPPELNAHSAAVSVGEEVLYRVSHADAREDLLQAKNWACLHKSPTTSRSLPLSLGTTEVDFAGSPGSWGSGNVVYSTFSKRSCMNASS